MVEILLTDKHQYITGEQQNLIEELLQTAAKVEHIEQGEVSITLVNLKEIQELNLSYREKDKPTDVLSFPMEDDDDIFLAEGEPRMLGDIIISIPRAQEQATEYGHSFERELGFLVVHGFLHLIGYDHESEAEAQEMFSRQEEILEKHGLVR
ncbi:rRNA maturation RNase YbeY [Caldalkalibacillus salinus]|uniref:rRNA maturation RNase YbeY n=1 Tax=Caldalkalibacillus salinus TaxID=2803787 RepID=UPI001923F152|nr:rRNA maturation RNase YbeY [Caldalkalibacillus salinus]